MVFLGHVVTDEGMFMDPAKVKLVINWPKSTIVTEIRSFLGLARYYQRFVEGFSHLATPLTILTEKV